MKISNSKKELARIISENGGWREGAGYLAMDTSGMVCGYLSTPKWSSSLREWTGSACFRIFISTTLAPNHQRTILSREEYFHLYPAPDTDGWIEWNGGECPVNIGTLIDVKYRDGHLQLGCRAKTRCDTELYATTHWRNSGGSADIIAYRLHKPEQSKPEFCESVMRSIPEPEAKPTIEQLASYYRNAKDYAERKQQEADAANADADAKLKALELAGEDIGLLLSPITEKQGPELVITDWRQLKVGDLVEITTTRDGVNIGEAATIIAIDENNENFPVTVTFPEDKYPLEYSYERPPTTWRFIRRP